MLPREIKVTTALCCGSHVGLICSYTYWMNSDKLKDTLQQDVIFLPFKIFSLIWGFIVLTAAIFFSLKQKLWSALSIGDNFDSEMFEAGGDTERETKHA